MEHYKMIIINDMLYDMLMYIIFILCSSQCRILQTYKFDLNLLKFILYQFLSCPPCPCFPPSEVPGPAGHVQDPADPPKVRADAQGPHSAVP